MAQHFRRLRHEHVYRLPVLVGGTLVFRCDCGHLLAI